MAVKVTAETGIGEKRSTRVTQGQNAAMATVGPATGAANRVAKAIINLAKKKGPPRGSPFQMRIIANA
jgi:phosphoribosylformylglycinamidine (FGAM) synthase-like enzyme